MSDTKVESKEAPKADAEQPREPQPPSSPQQQQSSSPLPTSPVTTSSSRAVTFKTSAQPAEDAVSGRKREREGSLEPSQLTPSREPIPAKKNRVEDSLQEEDDDADNHNQAETEKVGQIRKKVDELSTGELKSAQATSASTPEPAAADAKDEAAAGTVTAKDATSESKKDSTSAHQPSTESQPAKASQDPPARTQPTFSAFSSKSSPFSAVPSSSGSSSSSSKSGLSAFAARSSSPMVGSGIKPSSLGSSIGSHHAENGSASPAAAASSSSSKPIAKGSSFGFGAFAGASPLAKAKGEAPATSEKESSQPESSTDKATFEQKLLSESKDDSASSETKSKPLLEAPEAETKTGQEDEESIHSIRAKLYTMAEDQSWKERGTGTLRVNVPKKSSDKRPARLVMRADGVLRVILNVSLFKGMKCELQEKFVRIVAFEDAKPVHYAIKLSNPNNAAALMDVLDDFVTSPEASSQA
ncbi:hypothetical protein NDA16_003297 [Ustilago loliicola]|nr:hypothetical protein NDA16_003297 [Ustilago loliicola]